MKAAYDTFNWKVMVAALMVIGLTAVSYAAESAIPAYQGQAPAGVYEVSNLSETWEDTARHRQVPVKIYWPKSETLTGPLPVIFVSHGLGGTREGYQYLGEYWASHGFIVVNVQHLGSDDSVWRGNPRPMEAMRNAAKDLTHAANRPRDMSFALDYMIKLNTQKGSPFEGRVDAQRVGAAGHSFGAYTVLGIAGQGEEVINNLGKATIGKLRDDRFKAIIPMSAPANARTAKTRNVYETITVPAFHMTGTRDSSPIGSTDIEVRRIPFDQITHGDGYLLTFKDGDHMVFSGGKRSTLRMLATGFGKTDEEKEELRNPEILAKRDAVQQELIKLGSLMFWRAYLLDDQASKNWLAGGGFKSALGQEGTFELKPAIPVKK